MNDNKKEYSEIIKQGFTTYTNKHIKDPTLPHHLFRTKMVIEAHMGVKGKAIVKLSTLAKEMGISEKQAQRNVSELVSVSNLKRRKRRYTYEYYAEPYMSVSIGNAWVSHIVPHGSPVIKINSKKNNLKNNSTSEFSNNKREDTKVLNAEEFLLQKEITTWLSQDVFKSVLAPKQIAIQVKVVLLKYGYESINRIYNQVAIRGANPHPSVFWNEIKKLSEKEVLDDIG